MAYLLSSRWDLRPSFAAKDAVAFLLPRRAAQRMPQALRYVAQGMPFVYKLSDLARHR